MPRATQEPRTKAKKNAPKRTPRKKPAARSAYLQTAHVYEDDQHPVLDL